MDLIDRQAAIDIVEFECGEWRGLASTIVKAIEQLPSAQPKLLQPWEVLVAQAVLPQPEIVRCEECLYRKICSWEKQGAKFCSFAEKREVTT